MCIKTLKMPHTKHQLHFWVFDKNIMQCELPRNINGTLILNEYTLVVKNFFNLYSDNSKKQSRQIFS